MAIEGIVLVRGCWFGFCAGSEATVCGVQKAGELMFCGGPVQAGGWRKRLRKAFVEEDVLNLHAGTVLYRCFILG